MQIDFGGEKLELFLTDTGEANTQNTMLLLQGWGTNTAVYNSIMNSAKSYCRVITYDIPGFGQSTAPSFAFSTDDYADLAFEVMSLLGIEKFAVAGHSHGGRTILNMLTRDERASKITKAVIIDGAGIVHEKTLKQKVKIAYYKFGKKLLSNGFVKKLFPDALEKFKDSHGSADYKSAPGVLRESLVKIVNDDYSQKLGKINVPTLLIWGDNDSDTPISDAHLLEKYISDCGLVTIRGGSHYSFLDNPNLTAGALRAFLAK